MNLYIYADSVGKPTAINPNNFTNAYNYTGNNPVNYVDPLGLWSLSANIYDVLGGSLTIGQNPSGSWFFTLGGGIGLGAGISYDPNGKSPGWNPCDQRHGSSIGLAADIGLGFGPLRFGRSDSAGVNYYGGTDFQGYYNPPSNKVKLKSGAWRFGIGGSAGGQISFF